MFIGQNKEKTMFKILYALEIHSTKEGYTAIPVEEAETCHELATKKNPWYYTLASYKIELNVLDNVLREATSNKTYNCYSYCGNPAVAKFDPVIKTQSVDGKNTTYVVLHTPCGWYKGVVVVEFKGPQFSFLVDNSQIMHSRYMMVSRDVLSSLFADCKPQPKVTLENMKMILSETEIQEQKEKILAQIDLVNPEILLWSSPTKFVSALPTRDPEIFAVRYQFSGNGCK
jgi:hypothetical protein